MLIELKYASANPYKIYYAPFQLLQYIWEWHSALSEVRGGLKKLRETRLTLGLTRRIPELKDGMRSAIAFGSDTRTNEVKRRYAKVLNIVNQHLPCGIPEIETWNLTADGPCRAD